jgi:tetratricopeptide (TPR) repeat protein
VTATTALLLALLIGPAALDEDPRFREARGRYDSMDLEGALARFELVLLDDSIEPADRATLLLWIGLTQAELGRFDDAEARFVKALALHPDAVLPTETSPKVKAMVEEARKRAKELPPEDDTEPELEADVMKDEDGTLRPRAAGVLIPSSGRARDAYGNEVDPEALRDGAAGGPPWLLISGGVVAGVGALAAGAGGVVGALALADDAAASTETDEKTAEDLRARAGVLGVTAIALLASGAVVLVAGGALATAGALVE